MSSSASLVDSDASSVGPRSRLRSSTVKSRMSSLPNAPLRIMILYIVLAVAAYMILVKQNSKEFFLQGSGLGDNYKAD